MSMIENTYLSAVLTAKALSQAPEQIPKEKPKTLSPKSQFRDEALLSEVSRSLNENKNHKNSPIAQDGAVLDINSVKKFIENHNDAIEQQANQSKTNVLALIS